MQKKRRRREKRQNKRKFLDAFSAVLNGENAATKKFPQTEAYGLWEFYLYRQKKERRQAPSDADASLAAGAGAIGVPRSKQSELWGFP